MGWSIGYDDQRHRDVGYGVPAVCDHPGCSTVIDRGLGYRCGGSANLSYDDVGCGLFFCGAHLWSKPFTHTDQDGVEISAQVCGRCLAGDPPFDAWSPDTIEWMEFKVTDESWQEWRETHLDQFAELVAALAVPWCMTWCESGGPYVCTLQLLHEGDHAARERNGHVLHTWPQKP